MVSVGKLHLLKIALVCFLGIWVVPATAQVHRYTFDGHLEDDIGVSDGRWGAVELERRAHGPIRGRGRAEAGHQHVQLGADR